MYKVKFNTIKFQDKSNRKTWERQLMNDFAVAINGKEFICKDESELYHRISFIDGSWCDHPSYGQFPFDTIYKSEENFIHLKSERYNEQKLPLSMYGICQGYVDKEKVINTVNEEGFIKISFSDFYDIRQGSCNFFKKCFIEITKIQ